MIVDFASLQGTQIEIEPFQVENQVVRNILQARSERGKLAGSIL